MRAKRRGLSQRPDTCHVNFGESILNMCTYISEDRQRHGQVGVRVRVSSELIIRQRVYT